MNCLAWLIHEAQPPALPHERDKLAAVLNAMREAVHATRNGEVWASIQFEPAVLDDLQAIEDAVRSSTIDEATLDTARRVLRDCGVPGV